MDGVITSINSGNFKRKSTVKDVITELKNLVNDLENVENAENLILKNVGRSTIGRTTVRAIFTFVDKNDPKHNVP